MKIYLHIGLPHCGADRIQNVLDDKRDNLARKNILFPRTPGRKNHTRLFMAITDPDHVDPLRALRGFSDPARQIGLRRDVERELAGEIENTQAETMILSATQFSTSLIRPTELTQLHAFLSDFSDDIEIVAHLDEQARVLAQYYADQVWNGRTASLKDEFQFLHGDAWAKKCVQAASELPKSKMFEVESAPYWLDYQSMVDMWEAEFGQNSVSLRPYNKTLFSTREITNEISSAFGFSKNFGKADMANSPSLPSKVWIERCRQMNQTLEKIQTKGRLVPRPLWRRILNEIQIDGPEIEPGSLFEISEYFHPKNRALVAAHPALTPECFVPEPKQPPWEPGDLLFGFRATQYLAAFLPMIDRATKEANVAVQALEPVRDEELTPDARRILPPLARENYTNLRGGRFAPHNRLGRINEREVASPYREREHRVLAPGSTGNVVVGCMKNEGPYIVEWVAYHRAIGVDNFIIYTNGCEDGTDEVLLRLQELGIVQHRNNDGWKGNSPQQYALNQSLKEDLIKNAEWIMHIDVDEFINVRTGNGTLQDFTDLVPDATNVAMTWRMFGHNGVTSFVDRPVIEQFDTCAPKYCPKPHTVWGFKTMFKNIGAYDKISCHRPNKLDPKKSDRVHWVNGSGQPMGDEVKEKGWRSGIKTVGYDHIQLNHYALRSADSFLIKRQRGRALHVDRSIGLNYWVRMDWGDHKDYTIKRNLPRLQSEIADLLSDPILRKHHDDAVAWHHAKAKSLHEMPEFAELYEQATNTNLNQLERVAYALALDMES